MHMENIKVKILKYYACIHFDVGHWCVLLHFYSQYNNTERRPPPSKLDQASYVNTQVVIKTKTVQNNRFIFLDNRLKIYTGTSCR